jgi:hypothetical protein
LDVTNPAPGTYCDDVLRGYAGSYKIKLFVKSSPTTQIPSAFISAMGAYLSRPSTSGVESLDSACITARGSPGSVTPVLKYFPFSSPNLFITASIEAYSDGSCTSGMKRYIFPSGFGAEGGNASSLTGTTAKATASGGSSDIYLSYAGVEITTIQKLLKAYLSATNGTNFNLRLSNNTSSAIEIGAMSITSSPANQMTVTLGWCSSTLNSRSECNLRLNLKPTVKGKINGTLIIKIDGVDKTFQVTGFGVKDTFKTAPQGLTGFTSLPSNKINSVFIEPSTGVRFVATDGGLAIHNGSTWSTKTTVNGLGSNIVNSVFAFSDGTNVHVYAATANGLSVSTNGGSSFTNYQSGTVVKTVFAKRVSSETRVYIGTSQGLKISRDGAVTFPYSSFVGSGVSLGVAKIIVNSTTD